MLNVPIKTRETNIQFTTMKKSLITSDKAPKAIGPYSHAVQVGDFVYTSGQIPIDPATGKVESSDIADQTRLVLNNLAAVLSAADLVFEDVVKTTIFLTSMSDFAVVNEIYAGVFAEILPARSTIEVAGLPLGVKIEIEAIACKK